MPTGAKTRSIVATMAFATIAFAQTTTAANTPCSGKKGGVSHCQGRTFVCNDGSVSGSKKNCSATMGTMGLLPADEMDPVAGKDCSCRSGRYCIGPKGGHYCLEDDGGKSYLRK